MATLNFLLSLSKPKQWLVTIAATAVSTYALDAVATAAGVLLVASVLLRGLDHVFVLLFLASTYVLWGMGLRVNLKANWALLEDTGTSINVLSKVAYDLVKLRTQECAGTGDRGHRRLCRHRGCERGAVLRRCLRRRPPQRLHLLQRRAHLSRGRTWAPPPTSTASLM